MTAVYLVASGVAASVVVGVICLAAVMGWGQMTRLQRWGLIWLAAGLMGASADRALQRPVGLFDVLMLTGAAVYLVATYGPTIWQRADAADGKTDGRVSLDKIKRL